MTLVSFHCLWVGNGPALAVGVAYERFAVSAKFACDLGGFPEGAGVLGSGAFALAITGVLAGSAGVLEAAVVVVVVIVDAATGGALSVGAGVKVAAGVVTVAVETVAVAGSAAAGALALVVGVGVAAAGVATVAVVGSAAAGALAAAVVQWSEIIIRAVTARVLSVTPKLGALTLFPVT